MNEQQLREDIEFVLTSHGTVEKDIDLILALFQEYSDREITRYKKQASTGGRPLNSEPLIVEHPVPCQGCGDKHFADWYLYPHQVYNSICPEGTGYYCLPCFAEKVQKYDSDRRLLEIIGKAEVHTHETEKERDLKAERNKLRRELRAKVRGAKE